ncbi:MAG: ankyrin repeat domain-containing protein [Parachlamydia sp.]|nr:ankyrin repeat domain-containing protein [Parachlamydia sp.]
MSFQYGFNYNGTTGTYQYGARFVIPPQYMKVEYTQTLCDISNTTTAEILNNTALQTKLINLLSDLNPSDSRWSNKNHTFVQLGLMFASEYIAMKLIRDGGDIRQRAFDKKNTLHFAAMRGFGQVVQHILNNDPIQKTEKDADGHTPFFYAAQNGHHDLFERLYAEDPIDQLGPHDMTPFLVACLTGNKQGVEFCLSKRANVLSVTSEGNSGLHLAARKGNAAFIAFLLKLGIPQGQTNKAGLTPIQIAFEEGNEAAWKVFNPGLSLPASFKKPLTPREAAERGDIVRLQQLIGSGFNPNEVFPLNNSLEGTLLLFATNAGHAGVVELLLAYQPEKRWAQMCYEQSLSGNSLPLMKLLFNYVVKDTPINTLFNTSHRRALEVVLENRYPEARLLFVNFLLEQSPPPDLKLLSHSGHSTLFTAITKDLALAKILYDKGARLTERETHDLSKSGLHASLQSAGILPEVSGLTNAESKEEKCTVS